ncbi:interferon regulatory factor 7 [Latimeria chalumnae]|uniref:interferon regulatory factor 7 n=1 Tax=Latimeria chalumnae TaxID=7897 RepID=UPI0003C16C28|nr:PREDICTED: interferon regulatory factor 7 [Latimeria chalumnae]|eukprot:XP_005995343.1 PREDICTED: interferon regulatory factor 7 [Latimeria chalumnae]
MPGQKPQFGNWLIEQINSGEYPGLCWLNLDRTIFRVPWKHHSRKDICDRDYKIFKRWAEVSGKLNELFTPSKWKTNFRCAMNSVKFFEMKEDNHDDIEDPHKVFQIGGDSQVAAAAAADGVESEEDENENLYVSPNSEGVPCNLGKWQQQILDDSLDHFAAINLGQPFFYQPAVEERSPAQAWWHGGWREPLNHEAHIPLQNGTIFNRHISAQNGSSPEMQLACGGQEHNGHVPVQNGFGAELPQTDGQISQNAISLEVQQAVSLAPAVNALEITIKYKGREVLHTERNCRQYHFFYQVPLVEQLQHHQICFPCPDQLPDERQVEYTNTILQNLKQGLLLEVKPKGIYCTRLDKCQVFWAQQDQPASAEQNKLLREVEMEIFSFEKFFSELKDFHDNKRGSPDYTIYLCFGQKLQDTWAKDKKLIFVEIVPKFCRFWHEVTQHNGASSLNSENVSLQLSGNSLFDLIESCMEIAMPYQ